MRAKQWLTASLIASIFATAVFGGIYSRYLQLRGHLPDKTPLIIVKANYIPVWYVHYGQRIGAVFIVTLFVTVLLAIATTRYFRRHNVKPS